MNKITARNICKLYRESTAAQRESGEPITPSAVQATVWLAWRSKFWAAGAFDSYDIG